MSEHGTNSSYTSGCRCEPCATAHREYGMQWRARSAERRKSERLQRVCVVDGCAFTVWSANAKVLLCAEHRDQRKRDMQKARQALRPHLCRDCGVPISTPRARVCDACRPIARRAAKKRGGRAELLRKYGMTEESYIELMRRQSYRCYGCGVHADDYGKNFHIDHDHACCPGVGSCGVCVRGLLCNLCNTGWGKLDENLAIVKRLHDRKERTRQILELHAIAQAMSA